MRLVALALVVTALGTASADANSASHLRWTQVGTTSWFPQADAKAVVWPVADGQLFVKAVGHRPRVLSIPADCFQPGSAYQNDYSYGGGHVLVRCRSSATDPVFAVLNATTGAVRRFVVHEDTGGYGVAFDAIGSQWASGPAPDYHAEGVTVWVNWRTGQRLNTHDDPFGPHRYLDPNAPKLGRPLCAPLRRTPMPAGPFPTDRYQPLEVDGSWALERPASPAEKSILRRCGSRRQRIIDANAQLGGGLLSWIGAGSTHVLRLRDGHQWTGAPLGAAHTAEAAYGRMPIPGSGAYRVMRASLRWP